MQIRVLLLCCVLSLMDNFCTQAQVFTVPNPLGGTTVSILEGAAASTAVLTVVVSPASSTITIFSVVDSLSNSKMSDFQLTTNTIRTTIQLDYETTRFYTITVKAVDTLPTTSTALFTVQVTDVNDNPPVFAAAGNKYTTTIDEELTVGTSVLGPFTVTDADTGESHRFSLTGVHSSYFNINPATGVVMIGQRLDRETTSTPAVFNQLTLEVRDSGDVHTATQTLSITLTDINDNSPTCTPILYTTTLAENTLTGITVATLTCTDNDFSAGIGTVSSYVIASGDDTPAKFSITVAGVVQTTIVPLDYESKSSYSLIIHIADGGTPTARTGTATVLVYVTNVNEFDPAWGVSTPAGPTFTVSESVPAGTSVVRVTATDADAGVAGQVTYSLVSTTYGTSVPVSGIFQLDTASGQVVTASLLDAETSPTYTLVLRASDGGSPVRSVSATVTVTVTDVNDNSPAFSPKSYTFAISETNARAIPNVWPGGQLTATDADVSNAPLEYQITGGDGLNKFRFSSTTPGLLERNAAIDVDKPTADPASYVLTVQASDKGVPNAPTRIGSATVTINITPLSNDHTPLFGTPVPSASPTVSETASVGTSVASLPATDNDMMSGAAQTITFAIAAGNNNNDFTIDSALGVVYTAKALDYETTTSYLLRIVVYDSGLLPSLTATTTLTVSVVNVNEHTPACSAYSMFASVNEAVTAQPSVVTTIGCTDADTGDTLVFSISPSNPSFTVNSANGQVSTILALDYETSITHILQVVVHDTLTPVRSATVTLTVLVQPVNEYPPIFSPSTYTKALAEDVPAGTAVTTVTATDADRGARDGTIRYSITLGNGLGAFTIDSTTGAIVTTAVGLDRETTPATPAHTLTVSACDDIPGAVLEHCVTTTVTVSLTDVNDNVPLCVPQNYQAKVTEPSVVGAVVATLTAVDDDEPSTPNSTPTFTISTLDPHFTISGANVVLAQVVDYETQRSHFLTIVVRDGGTPALSSTCQLTVTIVSANEFPPVTTVPNFSTTLVETTAVGTVVYDVTATDADKGNGSVISYTIISGNTNNDFFCYPDTGSVIVWNALDFDTPPQAYNLSVAVSDDGGKTTDFWLHVQLTDVNDQTPVFTQNVYSVTLDENVANGTSVVRVTAVDTDIGPGGVVTYTAVSGDGMAYFDVHPNGRVTTSNNIDREFRRSYSLVIQAADGGTPSLSSTALAVITINDLNDNAPVFSPSDFTVSLSENAAVSASVTTVAATDADKTASNNVFSYVLSDTFFQVDQNTGVVTVKQALDRESTASHVLEILAPDSGAPALTGTATVTVILIDVNDNSPVIVGTYNPQVSENTAVGTIITTITATDADAGDNARLTYAITPAGNINSDFRISSSSGYIQVRNSLDRERTGQYNLVVEVSDNGTPSRTTTVTVVVDITDINDNAPIFGQNSYAFTVDENVAAGQFVGQVAATDRDAGVNAVLVYSVVLFFTGTASHFALDAATGRITTTASLDREAIPQYIAWIRVTDSGVPQLHDDVNVTIAVNDINDNAPVFDKVTYYVTVVENDPVGTGVVTVTVTDDDIGVNADVTLVIDTSTVAGVHADKSFQVTSGTGVVAVKKVIDRETDASFTFTIVASDGGMPSLTSSATVIVTVIDVNDNAPVFTKTYYNRETAYAGQCTRSIATVTATDLDSGVNGEVSYYLDPASTLFLMDAKTGELSLHSPLTADVMYQVNVSARDGGTPTQTSATPALIRVDAFIPNDVAVTFKLGITVEAFLPMQDVFLAQLQVIMRQLYPLSVARLWCAETNGDGLADVQVYFLSDNSTESVASSNAAKYYVSQSNARGAYTSQPGGEPNAALSGSEWAPFDIIAVLPYKESQTPYAQTAEGIAVITVSAIIGLALLATAAYMGARYCRTQKHLGRQPTRRLLVQERRPPAPKNNIHPGSPPLDTANSHKPRPMRFDDDFFWKSSVRS